MLDNMTGSPIRVRCQAFDGVLEFRAVVPQQADTRPRVRTRPRRRLRFYAQEVLSRRIVSNSVGSAVERSSVMIRIAGGETLRPLNRIV